MIDRKLAFIYSPEIEAWSYPPDCPFKTERAGLTRRRLRSLGLFEGDNRFEFVPTPATSAQLEQFHTRRYLNELQQAARGELSVEGLHMGLGGPDTPIFRELFSYSTWACGAALAAADLILARKADIAFSLAGGFHHAMPEKASGFCYLNDAVLACSKLAAAGKRVAYLDVDAHHGDGVQLAFYRRKDVLTISLHETGRALFPWSGFEDEIGEESGLGFNVNVPLPVCTNDEGFLLALDQLSLPLLRAYGPDVLVLELGMDTLAGDPLTHLQMTNNIVGALLRRLLALERPILVLGGGGYHVENTVRAWALAWWTCSTPEEEDDLFSLGMGGVMLGNTEWAGGLRDRELPVDAEVRQSVIGELSTTIHRIQNTVFPYHGLGAASVRAEPGVRDWEKVQ
jgi:acetoin utilization protein AcuC